MSNQKSRITHSLKNITTGLLAQLVQMILGFISRTVFIRYLSVEYLGVSSLFSNILTMLSLAELGVASAFVYELYKPLAKNDKAQVAVVLRYFQKTYTIVGVLVLGLGLLLLPFLDQLIAETPATITEDIRLLFVLYLIGTASTYFFSYKISLLDADQKAYITTLNHIRFVILQHLLQILVLIFTQDFVLYLVVQIATQLLSNIVISRIVDNQYPFLKDFNSLGLPAETKRQVITNVKATFLTKIGGVMVNATDNIFVSMFVGLAILGKFSNYVMLYALVSGLLMIIFANIKSSVANFVVNETLDRQREIFRTINFLNFILFGLSALVLYFCINDFISIWIGDEYLLSNNIAFLLSLNFFMVGMQNAFWTFKSSYGYFRYGRYLVLGTAAINLGLSYFLGLEFGVVGILLATAIARILTNFWYDPYIVLKKGLKENPLHYLFRFLQYLLVLMLIYGSLTYGFKFMHGQGLVQLLIKGLSTLAVFGIFIALFYYRSTEFKSVLVLTNSMWNRLRRRSA